MDIQASEDAVRWKALTSNMTTEAGSAGFYHSPRWLSTRQRGSGRGEVGWRFCRGHWQEYSSA